MPLHQPLTAVVLDIGQAYTKVGIAAESAPRAIVPTVLKVHGRQDEPLLADIFETPKIDKKLLIRKLKMFFEYLYFKFLQVNPKNRRVMICESFASPTVFRESIAEVLLIHFSAPSVLFAPHHLLTSYTVAADTALVLDSSEYESVALPIIEGTPILWAWRSAPLAGRAIHQQIQTFIRAGGLMQTQDGNPVKITEDLPLSVIEDIKVKSCFVTEHRRAKEIQGHKLAQWEAALKREKGVESPISARRPTPPPDMVYPMGGHGRLMIPGLVREEAAEILFEQDNDRLSLPTLVLDSILKCPVDSRKALAANLILSGGTSMLPGFSHRLLSELEDLVAIEERYRPLSECRFCVHNTPVRGNIVSWLGASIYASLETFPHRSITKEYFIENKHRLPDWCVLDLRPPEFLPEKTPSIKAGRKSLPYLGSSALRTSSRSSVGSVPRSSAAVSALAALRLAQAEKAHSETK